MYQKTCIGCDEEFETKYSCQKRCKKQCGTRKSRSRSETNYDAQAQAREEALSEPTKFVAVDGEGFNREVDVFTRYEWVTDMEEVEKLMEEGTLQWEHQFDDNDVLRVGFWETKMVHQYELFGIGQDYIGEKGKSLSYNEIFAFLYSKRDEYPDHAFVGYFLGYDYTNWIKNISEYEARKLLTASGIAGRTIPETGFKWPVNISDDWQIDFLGNKRFQLRPFVPYANYNVKIVRHKDGTETPVKQHPYKWMYICDAGSFFQTSLLNAIDPKKSSTPAVSDSEFAILKTGKGRRDVAEFDDETIRYNQMENEVLPRLLEQLDDGFREDGIRLNKNQWYGPGAAAQKYMDLIKIPTGEEIREVVPVWAEEPARYAYYGGWFETTRVGPTGGTSWSYDINSAYPHVIRNLPCLLHGKWERGRGRPPETPENGFVLAYVETSTFADRWDRPMLGGLSHRQPGGAIVRPLETKGWHFLHEIEAARRAGCHEKERYFKWVSYRPYQCECGNPFQSVEDLYLGRLAVGKNTPNGKAKKLVYNSIYGKLAQSIGHPKYANAIYASLITSGCRTMILDSIATHPDKTHAVLMIATDGIVFKSRHPSLDIDPARLGAWEEST